MNQLNSTIELKGITYDHTSMSAKLEGYQMKSHLSYWTEMEISFSQLNQILSQLQKNNGAINVYDLIAEERLSADYTQYFLNASRLENPSILITNFQDHPTVRQIRA